MKETMNKLDLLSTALAYIEQNLCEPVTAEDVAVACYCSRTSLQNLFKNISHYGVKEYIIKRRITRAAQDLLSEPDLSLLDIAMRYCYQSHEAFTRAFEQVWNCTPSDFRKNRRFSSLCPRLSVEHQKGDHYMANRRPVDISELYDLFRERKDCYFVCCDIQYMIKINEIAHKAGDLAILEVVRRMELHSGENDYLFRIGGDEFVLLTGSKDAAYAEDVADRIRGMNGETLSYEDQQIPLNLYVSVAKYEGSVMRYEELFSSLHQSIQASK